MSEWFDGLKYAEDVLWKNSSMELFVEHCDGMQSYDILIRRKYEAEKPWNINSSVSLDFGQGVIDYLELLNERSKRVGIR